MHSQPILPRTLRTPLGALLAFVWTFGIGSLWGPTQGLAQGPASIASQALPTAVDPNQMVLKAVEQAVWGPSLKCRIQQTSLDNEYRLIGEGEYISAGQGSGRLRMTMQFVADEVQTNFLQVSDGRLIWTSVGEKEPLKRINLDEVRAALGGRARNAKSHPAVSLYLAVGGHAEMLRTLYHHYRWFKVYARKDEWQLIGTLRTENAPIHATCLVDQLRQHSDILHETPTDVRMTLSRDGALPLFPKKIEYFDRKRNADGTQGNFIAKSTIIFEDIETPTTITKETFVFQINEELEQFDPETETNDYLPLIPFPE
jgi:hypothetical protein